MNPNNNSGDYVISRTFNAPLNQVWRAISTKAGWDRWFVELPEFRADIGFKFRFDADKDGVKYIHLCEIIEVIPARKLAFSWVYQGHPGHTVVSIELFPEGTQTELVLTHSGLETLPQTPDFDRSNFNQGWTSIIGTHLKEAVESPDTSDREIVITRDLDAPRDLVWEAMTDPKHVVNWWGPRGFSTKIEEMDLRVGGKWYHTMVGPDGTRFPNRSIFTEIVENEKIVFNHGGGREEGPGVDFVATWTFESLGPKKTRITARMVFPTPDQRDIVVKEFGAIEGGRQTLERLHEYLPKMA